MLFLALALATMPQPVGRPLPGDLAAYAALYDETRAAATRIDLTVDPTGQPVRCDVTLSDGSRALDRVACEFLMRRTRFTPALDPAGVPVTAVVREDFTVNRQPAVRRSGPPAATARMVDFALPVAGVKPGSVLTADLRLMTDATGHVTSCDVATSTGYAALDRIACREIEATSFAPARNRDGGPIRALRQVSIGFVAGDVPL